MPSDTAGEREALAAVLADAWGSSTPSLTVLRAAGTFADAVLAALPALGWVRAEEMSEEWGVRWPWSQTVEPNTSSGSASWRAVSVHGGNGQVVHRHVTPWTEAGR